eukprot:2767709-Prymnesium_polylepis.1
MALDELPSPSACALCSRTAPPLTRRRRVRCTRGVLSHARANGRTALLVLLSFRAQACRPFCTTTWWPTRRWRHWSLRSARSTSR